MSTSIEPVTPKAQAEARYFAHRRAANGTCEACRGAWPCQAMYDAAETLTHVGHPELFVLVPIVDTNT
ncbi:hypothetical protein [Phytomonospora endophytica]|uniref:Uncharacterized protein n=1 Tax=Phytomonospora endophytica TaxID=714109 RepID=A0A841G0M0_9ACTN|nr:hypothetical protein [Phytomonospora endophytica]MBB6037710.1 hypothetical protein [Phytomonospora endophytica]GIG67761.1 hypothetical protein Pen01_40560 [Phytomonospora endophytica]